MRLRDGATERVCRAEFDPTVTVQQLLYGLLSVTVTSAQQADGGDVDHSEYDVLARNHGGQQWRVMDPQQLLRETGLLHGCEVRVRPRLKGAARGRFAAGLQPAAVKQGSWGVVQPRAAAFTGQTEVAFVIVHPGRDNQLSGAAGPSGAAALLNTGAAPKLTVATLLRHGAKQLGDTGEQQPTESSLAGAAAGLHGGFPLYGAVAPLLIAVIVFLVLQNPLVLLFGVLTPALLVAGKLDGRHQRRQQTQHRARTQWQQALLGTVQQQHLARLRELTQSIAVMPLPLRSLFAPGAAASFSTSSAQRELLLRGAWQQMLTPPAVADTEACLFATANGVLPLRNTVIYSDSPEQLLAACHALLAQLLYRYCPEELQLRYTAEHLPVQLLESLSLVSAYTELQSQAAPRLSVQLEVLLEMGTSTEHSQLGQLTLGRTDPHPKNNLENRAEEVRLVFVQIRNGVAAAPEWVAAAGLLQLPHQEFREFCATLAPLRPQRMLVAAAAPQWLQLQGFHDLPNVAAVIRNWQNSRYIAQLSADFCLDLDDDGPHFLLGGTTGSGKSELLQNLLLSLACQSPPELLRMVLVDYKGGTSFGQIAALPHVEATVTDLAAAGVKRLFTLLRLEMQAREERLRSAGCANISEFNNRNQPQRVMPKLLVVIDEFAALLLEHPGAEQAVVDFAQRGRALGIHLVLSTQRPAGAISDKIRANIETRIALRVTTAVESQDIIGSASAAEIAKTDKGRCYVRGATGLRQATVQPVNVAVPDRAAIRLIFPDSLAAAAQPPAKLAANDAANTQPATIAAKLTTVLKNAAAACSESPAAAAHSALWVPELPRKLTLKACEFARAEHLETYRQRQLTGTDLARVTLLLGGAGSGKTSAIAAIAHSWHSCTHTAAPENTIARTMAMSRTARHTIYLSATQTNDRFRVLQTLTQAKDALREGGKVLLVLDEATPVYTAISRGDTKIMQALREIMMQPQARTIITAQQQRLIPPELQQEVQHTWYCDSISANASAQLPYALQEILEPQLQITGRALHATHKELLQFATVAPHMRQLLHKIAEPQRRPSAASWAVDAVTGSAIQVPQQGLVILSCKTVQALTQIMAKTVAALADTELRQLPACPAAAPQQPNISAALSAVYNGNRSHALLITDLTQLAEPTIAELLQLHTAAAALPETAPLILIGAVRKTPATWQQRQLYAAADTVLCCGLDDSEQPPAVLLPHLDRFAKLSPLQGYLVQQDNCQLVDFASSEEAAC
ncbi:FtsK/SpoIIIE domain-containing protein [Canibacter oris]|uniref:Putative ATPase n=1 Tax=Canibacter oris TaxID=1365628 RepID=A0A840DGU0_9MICO|nr:FtsK/SpoIIIE domain-containing protein [Canibacter oris]MBB4070985.1 putative ATPase [Canibacter oris]